MFYVPLNQPIVLRVISSGNICSGGYQDIWSMQEKVHFQIVVFDQMLFPLGFQNEFHVEIRGLRRYLQFGLQVEQLLTNEKNGR